MTDYLDEIQARADATPHGPWTWRQMLACQRVSNPEAILIAEAFEGADSEVTDTPIAAFIAHARTDVPRLVAALRAVEALCAEARAGLSIPPIDCTGSCSDGPCDCSGVFRVRAWDLDPDRIRTAIRDALDPA